MKISIVGNVLKDVYLNLDTRTENFETDRNGVRWLDIAFSTSEHHFFNRTATLAGAAISFEVFAKMGLAPSVIGAKLRFEDGGVISDSLASTYRYILVASDAVSFLVPTVPAETDFVTPDSFVDYLYIDRSAHLTRETAGKISAYLDFSANTKLAIYLQNPADPAIYELAERADLIFVETRHSSGQNPRFPGQNRQNPAPNAPNYRNSHTSSPLLTPVKSSTSPNAASLGKAPLSASR